MPTAFHDLTTRVGSFDLRHDSGPFDVIGDVHGCLHELNHVLRQLGHAPDQYNSRSAGRKLIFLGDLSDRGPFSGLTLRLVMKLVDDGAAYYTPGNHCNKLLRYLQGKQVQLSHGLEGTVEEVHRLERQQPGFTDRVKKFIANAPPYLWLDRGKLVVAHAGIKETMIGYDSSRVRAMCLYGDVTGEKNPDGTPVRLDWARDYRGEAAIVYGHTPVSGPQWVNNTINIDQGCVFGGWLTALRWPERDMVQIRASQAYDTQRLPAFLRPLA